MKQKFAYIQFSEIPGPRAHSIFVVQTCFAASQLNKQVNLIIPQKIGLNNLKGKNIWAYYGIKSQSFSVIRLKNFLFKPLFKVSKLIYLTHWFNVSVFALQAWLYAKAKHINLIQTSDPEILSIFNLFSFIYKPKIIFDVHLDPPDWLSKHTINKADLVVCNCDYFKKQLIKKGVLNEKIIVLPNGYNSQDFKFTKNLNLKEKLKIPKENFVIGYIGRLETFGQEKGISLLLTTIAKLYNKQVTVLIIGGPDKMISKYQALAKKLSLSSKQAVFHSQVKPYQVAQYINIFDLAWLIYPDIPHYRYKMSPMKTTEYMAANKPIIASNFPSINQLLNQNNSFLVDPNKQQAVLTIIKAIVAHYPKAQQKALKAYKEVKSLTWLNRKKLVLQSIGEGL